MNTVHEAALDYLAQGISVVPCQPGLRYPMISWGLYRQKLPTEAELAEWFENHPDRNLAMVTGKLSGVTVIDIDGDEGLRSLQENGLTNLPITRSIKTPHGFHLYYRYIDHPGIQSVAGVMKHIDVKHDGGCVCVPPSHVADGAYAVFNDAPVSEFTLDPNILVYGAQTKEERERAHDSWLTNVILNGAPKGERNHTATRLAGYFRSKGVPEDVTKALMQGFADRCVPPMRDAEADAIVKSVWRYAGSVSLDSMYSNER